MDEIRAEQTHIKHQPPETHKHTHTLKQTQEVSKARWRRRKIDRKQKVEGRESEFRGGKILSESLKQVKSEAARLASQHRGW